MEAKPVSVRKKVAPDGSETRRRLRYAELLLDVTRRMAGYSTLDEVLNALVDMRPPS